MNGTPEYMQGKSDYLHNDDWHAKDKQLSEQDAEYEKARTDNQEIFDQTEAIMRTGHFDDRLAYPIFRIAQLMHHRMLSVDIETRDGEFHREGHERMRIARDLLLAASDLLSHEPAVQEVVEDLLPQLTGEKTTWGTVEYGLLHLSGSWFATEKGAEDWYQSLLGGKQPQGDEYLVRRQRRPL